MKLTKYYSLFTIHYALLTMYYALCTIHYALFTMHYTLCTMHYALFIIYCTLYTMHYALFIIYYALCTIHYSLYTMYYALCIIHYSLFIRIYYFIHIHTYSLFHVEIRLNPVFLVLTRSPRRVENFRSLPDEIRRSDLREFEKEAKRRKKINISLLSLRPLSFPFDSFPCMFCLFVFKVGPTCPFFFHFLVRFSPETIYFVSVSIFFILIEYSLNICHFSKFFKNPVFRFHSTLVAYKFVKYSNYLGIKRNFSRSLVFARRT